MRNLAQSAHASEQLTATRRTTSAIPPEQSRRKSRTEEIHTALFSHYRG